MQNSIEKSVYQGEVTIFCQKYDFKSLKKSLAPILALFDKAAKSAAPDFPGPTQFFSVPFVFWAEILAPWQHCTC
jgi:hypothetical protein